MLKGLVSWNDTIRLPFILVMDQFPIPRSDPVTPNKLPRCVSYRLAARLAAALALIAVYDSCSNCLLISSCL